MEAALTGLPEFEKIDWQAPWLAIVREQGADIAGENWRSMLNAKAVALGLANARGLPLRFVLQQALPAGTAYETFIFETGCVPTRANLHDVFNALIWLNHPKIKSGLNALQARELGRDGVQSVRGQVRDGATLFDENAALFVSADAAAVDALRDHDWQALFIGRREQFGTVWDVFPFGHALLEKLTAPFKAITAHAKVVRVEPAFFTLSREEQRTWLDRYVARDIERGLSSSDFTPLPVLGVPGWASGQDEAYYLDRSVFRPKRMKANLELQ